MISVILQAEHEEMETEEDLIDENEAPESELVRTRSIPSTNWQMVSNVTMHVVVLDNG